MSRTEKNPGAVATARGRHKENTLMSDLDLTAAVAVDELDDVQGHLWLRTYSLTAGVDLPDHDDDIDGMAFAAVVNEVEQEVAALRAWGARRGWKAPHHRYVEITAWATTTRHDPPSPCQTCGREVPADWRVRAGDKWLCGACMESQAWGRGVQVGRAAPMPCDATCGPSFCAEACAEAATT